MRSLLREEKYGYDSLNIYIYFACGFACRKTLCDDFGSTVYQSNDWLEE